MRKKLVKVYNNNKSFKAFVWIILGGFGTALSVFLRNKIIYGQYDNPPTLLFAPLLFEYLSFSLVAFLFPWSWNLKKDNKTLRALSVGLTGLIFVLIYFFILSIIEWYARGQGYDLWMSYRFMLLHSSIFTSIVYAAIAAILFFLGVVNITSKPISYSDRIPYRIRNDHFFVEIDNIVFFESEGNYVSVHSSDGTKVLIRKKIGDLESELNPTNFLRVHRRTIINTKKLTSYTIDPNGGYLIRFENGENSKVSKSYSQVFKKFIAESKLPSQKLGKSSHF
ncbi:LytTR family DNA-binding domain-containing protein [Flagellimonas sp. S3867]|uniref:LytR/AlgR family response regulator transcription factor n=1 Tax=Flagellimonas sp. S3867 TaxID=2768063 RepID=UPI0016864858|nr:LytTR family DNA-binding domain-containing protein [Flagellimonas sp. S3867]